MWKRKRGTGAPDPKKDRSAHEAARGQKKRSLRDLSNVLVLDDHIQDILHELDHQSDRGVALIAASMLDIGLRWAIMCRLGDYPDSDKILFEDEGAPLGTFANRIKIAKAIGVIGPYTEGHLNSVRLIRNQFAHSPLKIDFANDLIAAEIDKLLADSPEWKPEWTPEKRRYVGTIITMIQALDAVTKKHGQEQVICWMQ
jgi:hypothetical protein